MINKLVKSVIDKDHAEFRKDYLKYMQEKYNEKKAIVKQYCMKRISLGKETGI